MVIKLGGCAKYILSLVLLGSIYTSCTKEEHIFKDKEPGENVDLGSIGAAASSSVESLTDGDLESYYQADLDERGIVEVEIESTQSQVVAYTLVSSGVIDQTEGVITAMYDPQGWTLYGSNDGGSWTEVDSRSEIEFFARFQEHIYYLDSPQSYSFYKFEFVNSASQTITLSDILFHNEDPYAAWSNFESPTVIFIDLAEDDGSQLYDIMVQDKSEYLKWHAREICTYLYFTDSDERFPVTTIEYYLEEMEGEVSYKSGSSPKIEIHYSTDWIQKSANESLLQLNLETRGVLFHEMTHAFQLEPQGIPSYSQGNVSWAAIEGMADAVRTAAGYHDYSTRDTSGSLMSGYQTTGFFLYWLTQAKEEDAMRNINASMREAEVWSWDIGLQKALGEEVSQAELWSEYKADEINYQDK